MNLVRTKGLVQKEEEEVTMRKNGSVQCLLFVSHLYLGKFSIWFWIHLPTRLLQLCQRTMALPVGRGMFTLFSYHPVPTEQLPIPKLNLTGTLVRGSFPVHARAGWAFFQLLPHFCNFLWHLLHQELHSSVGFVRSSSFGL